MQIEGTHFLSINTIIFVNSFNNQETNYIKDFCITLNIKSSEFAGIMLPLNELGCILVNV